MSDARVEDVPGCHPIWQSETAKTYQCPFCLRAIFSQYEGDKLPMIICGATFYNGHRLEWAGIK